MLETLAVSIGEQIPRLRGEGAVIELGNSVAAATFDNFSMH